VIEPNKRVEARKICILLLSARSLNSFIMSFRHILIAVVATLCVTTTLGAPSDCIQYTEENSCLAAECFWWTHEYYQDYKDYNDDWNDNYGEDYHDMSDFASCQVEAVDQEKDVETRLLGLLEKMVAKRAGIELDTKYQRVMCPESDYSVCSTYDVEYCTKYDSVPAEYPYKCGLCDRMLLFYTQFYQVTRSQ